MTHQTLASSTPVASSLVQDTPRQQTVARLLGAETFTTIPWRSLLQEGALVQLHIGRCRFSTRLLLEDIGMHITDEQTRATLTRWLILGEKRLLPEAYMKALARIESSARYALKEQAFQTELGHFVPVTSYLAWRTKTEGLRDEYLGLRDEILARHRELARQVVTEYEAIATDTYQRLRATHPELVHEGQHAFVAAYCNRIAGQIPTPERIRESFTFTFFRVDGVQQLGAVPAETEATTGPSPEALPEADAALPTLRLQEARRARAQAILEQDVRHDAQARVNAALESFLSSIVAQLRTLTYDAATDVLSTLRRRGGDSFSPRSKMQLEHLLNRVRALNFFGDTEMDQMMTRVQEIVECSPTERQHSLGEITRTLRAIATTTRATLLDLDEEIRTPPADLGIAAYPTAHLVASARAELRLPPLDLTHLACLPAHTRTRAGRAEFGEQGEGSLWQFLERQQRPARTARAL
ncbi:MAG TPA: hypothetical protein VFV38_17075 [Ktedonobacteraceae bacterium]|nr:hypothetical protein [Ktedonobacteraceae bacterium]